MTGVPVAVAVVVGTSLVEAAVEVVVEGTTELRDSQNFWVT